MIVLTFVRTFLIDIFHTKHLVGLFSSREDANVFIEELMEDVDAFKHFMGRYYDDLEEIMSNPSSIIENNSYEYGDELTPEEFMNIPSNECIHYHRLAEFLIEEVPILQSQKKKTK